MLPNGIGKPSCSNQFHLYRPRPNGQSSQRLSPTSPELQYGLLLGRYHDGHNLVSTARRGVERLVRAYQVGETLTKAMGAPEGMIVARKTNLYSGWTTSDGANAGEVSIVGSQFGYLALDDLAQGRVRIKELLDGMGLVGSTTAPKSFVPATACMYRPRTLGS
jgi:hypothetical protein